MNLDEMKHAWSEHAVKLDRVLKLNLQALESLQMDKSRSALSRYKAYRVFEMIAGIIFAGLLGVYLVHRLTVPTLAFPALILGAFAIAGIAGCVRQLVLLNQISFADPVTSIQAKLETVKLHMLETTRLMILSLPFYFAYITIGFDLLLGTNILVQGERAYIYANVVVSMAFLLPTIWLFRNLNFRNAGNPVIRLFINGAGGKQLLAATDFLNQIEEFKAE